ncbi:MAG: YhdP family protein [Gammaproteobacteria bacterium]|nr:YhdP family protein [Gammaproteobacteria bacterium]
MNPEADNKRAARRQKLDHWGRRLWRISATGFASLVIVLALLIGILRFVSPLVPAWTEDAEAQLSTALGFPVRIEALDLRFDWIRPELVLTGVALLDPASGEEIVAAEALGVVISASDFLHLDELRPHRIRILELRATVTLGDDGVRVSSYALPESDAPASDFRDILELALRRANVEIIDANLRIVDQRSSVGSGIDNWEVRNIDLHFQSDGSRHSIDLDLLPPGLLGETVSLSIDATGPPRMPEDWEWQAGVAVTRVDIARLREQVQWPGLGRFSGELFIDGTLEGRGIERLGGEGRFEAGSLRFGSDQDSAFAKLESIDQLAFDWTIEHDSERSGIGLDALVLVRDHGRWPETHLKLDWLHPADGEQRLSLVSQYLSLAELAVIASALPRGRDEQDWTIFDWIAAVNPVGQVSELIIDIPLDDREADWRVGGELENFSMTATRGLPGMARVSGEVHGTRDSGNVELTANDSALRLPRLFREPLPIRQLALQLDWQRQLDGWELHARDLHVVTPAASASATGNVTIADDGEVSVDVEAMARDVDLAQKSAYLPVGVMSDALVTWLDRGVVDGHVPEARLTWRGPVSSYPYRDGKGVFNIAFQMQDTRIDYVPGWPRLDGLQADVEFSGPSLHIDILQARSMGLVVANGEASIPEFRDKQLDISAEVDMDLGAAFEFIRATPLADKLRGVTESMEASGPSRAALRLDIPLVKDSKVGIDIDLDLLGASLKPHVLPWPVSELQGQVSISERQASASGIEGQLLEHPVTLAMTTVTDDEAAAGIQQVEITASGRAAVAPLAEWLPSHWAAELAGSIDFETDVVIPVQAAGVPTVDIRTGLDQLASSLPHPLQKPAGVAWPADFQLRAIEPGHLEVAGIITERLATRLLFRDLPVAGDEAGSWFLERGQVRHGSEAALPDLPAEPGVFIDGRVPLTEPLAWVELEQAREASASGRTELQAVTVAADKVRIKGFEFPEQSFDFRLGEQAWTIETEGPDLAGTVTVPQGVAAPGRVVLDLDRLVLRTEPASEEQDPQADEVATPARAELDGTESMAVDPRVLPEVELDIRELVIGDYRFGHAKGRLERSNIGYVTTGLVARSPTHDMTVNGRWERLDDGHYTSLQAELVSTDLKKTLTDFGYRTGLHAKDAKAELALTWHAPPFVWRPERLNGEVSLDFKDGSIDEVNQGAGRLFGLLSLGALPRRLILDFSDVFEAGLPFDTMEGDFVVSDGSAYTTNLRVKGPSMAALMVGRTGIAAQDYDQLVIVDPNVSGSLPLAGALAAGPNVGAAILVLAQLLKAPLADIAQVKYRVTGSWDEPVITDVTEGRPAEGQATPAEQSDEPSSSTPAGEVSDETESESN